MKPTIVPQERAISLRGKVALGVMPEKNPMKVKLKELPYDFEDSGVQPSSSFSGKKIRLILGSLAPWRDPYRVDNF